MLYNLKPKNLNKKGSISLPTFYPPGTPLTLIGPVRSGYLGGWVPNRCYRRSTEPFIIDNSDAALIVFPIGCALLQLNLSDVFHSLTFLVHEVIAFSKCEVMESGTMGGEILVPEQDVVELTTFRGRDTYVYVIPAAGSLGHRAELWNVDKWFKVNGLGAVTVGAHAMHVQHLKGSLVTV